LQSIAKSSIAIFISINQAPGKRLQFLIRSFVHCPDPSGPRTMTVSIRTLSLFYVSFVQQALKQLVWRLSDSTTGKKI